MHLSAEGSGALRGKHGDRGVAFAGRVLSRGQSEREVRCVMDRGHPCPHEREARTEEDDTGTDARAPAWLRFQLDQDLHPPTHLFIGVEKMGRHAQTYSGTTVDKNFSFAEMLHHRWSIFDIDHD